MDYADYQHLLFDRRPNGVVLIHHQSPRGDERPPTRALHWD